MLFQAKKGELKMKRKLVALSVLMMSILVVSVAATVDYTVAEPNA